MKKIKTIFLLIQLFAITYSQELCVPYNTNAEVNDNTITIRWGGEGLDPSNEIYSYCFPLCELPAMLDTIDHIVDNGTGGWYRNSDGEGSCGEGLNCDSANEVLQFSGPGFYSASGSPIDSRMILGPFPIPNDPVVYFEFTEKVWYGLYASNFNLVEISSDNKATWNTVFESNAFDETSEYYDRQIDFSQYSGEIIYISFRYIDTVGDGEAWAIDNLNLYSIPSPELLSSLDFNYPMSKQTLATPNQTLSNNALPVKNVSYPMNKKPNRSIPMGPREYNPITAERNISRNCLNPEEETEITFICGGGDWEAEVSWAILDSLGNQILTGLAPDTVTACLVDGVYTAVGFDAYGDGWNDAYLVGIDSDGEGVLNFTFFSGTTDSVQFRIGTLAGCMDPFANNYNSQATEDDGSCDYNSCDENRAYVYNSPGYWPSEVSWTIFDSTNTPILNGIPDEYYGVCLPTGDYKLVGYDTYGDGWNESYISILDSNYSQLVFWTVEAGFSDSTYFYIGPIYGCTDPVAGNYNAQATADDGSCDYCFEKEGTIVYMNGDSVGFTRQNSYTVEDLNAGTEYCLSASAVYDEGISEQTESICLVLWDNVSFSPMALDFNNTEGGIQSQSLDIVLNQAYSTGATYTLTSPDVHSMLEGNSLLHESFDSENDNMYDPSGLFGGLWLKGNAVDANSDYFDYGFSMDNTNFTYINDDKIGAAGGSESAYLITKEIEVESSDEVFVSFDVLFPQPAGSCSNPIDGPQGGINGDGYSEDLKFMLSSNYGETWVVIDSTMGIGSWDWVSRMYNITEHINGESKFIMGLYYSDCNGNWAYGVGVDNFRVKIGSSEDWLVISPYAGRLEDIINNNVLNTDVTVSADNGDILTSSIVLSMAGETFDIPVSFSSQLSNDNFVMLPNKYKLYQNYPNPFNPRTKIKFDIKNDEKVQISIYDIMGKEVTQLVNRFHNAGNHMITWNGKTGHGTLAPAGLYYYVIITPKFRDVGKMVLLK